MASNAFFITERYLKNNSPLSDNIDVKDIYPHAKTAEDIYIQEAIGTSLYDRLIDSITASPQNTTSDEVVLLKKIRDALVWYTAYDALPFVWVKLRNVGLVKQSGENLETVSQAEMNHLRKELKNKADFYMKRVQTYLCENAELFPDFTCSCSSCCATGNAVTKGNTSAMAFEEDDFCPPTSTTSSSSTTAPYAKTVNEIAPDADGNITISCADLCEDELDAKADKATGLVSGGAITIGTFSGSGTNNDVRITEATWYIVGEGSFATIGNRTFADLALSSAGTQRYVGFYGDNLGAIVKVEGSEAALATPPATPAGHALIGYVLITDGSIGATADLSGYLLKSDKATPADVVAGTVDDKYMTPYSLEESGILDKASASEYFAGTSNVKILTPLSAAAALKKYSRSSSQTSAITGTTSNTKVGSGVLIPANTFKVGDVVCLRSFLNVSGASGSSTTRFYVNTIDDLSGATLLGTGTATASFFGFVRHLSIRSATATVIANASLLTALSDFGFSHGGAVGTQALNIDWTTDKYLILAYQPNIVGSSTTGELFDIIKQ